MFCRYQQIRIFFHLTETFKSCGHIAYLIAMVRPSDMLQKSMNSRISLLLKDNRKITGKLVGFDDYMNLVLEDSEETTEEGSRRLGTVILRGNNVVSMAPL